MSKKINQHYVPQFYFRLFSRDGRHVHSYMPKPGRLIHNAAIKGQCAKYDFYGDGTIEGPLSEIENEHAIALRSLIEIAWSETFPPLTPEIVRTTWQAVALQQSRTELAAELHSQSAEAMATEAFTRHLMTAPGINNRERLVSAMKTGEAKVTFSRSIAAFQNVVFALENWLLISDLDFILLRNNTDYPFVFCDSPVVFANSYYRNVTQRGVLGLQTPGLQIFFPLDSDTMIMFFDAAVYRRPTNSCIVDLIHESDVSQLNALQLHNHTRSIYFAHDDCGSYLQDLWSVHKKAVQKPRSNFVRRDGWLLDGAPTNGLVQIFQPHPNIRLDLTFIQCDPIDEGQYRARRRSPSLVTEAEARAKRRMANRDD
ncbi:MAG: hypothetical protein JWP89_2527 [Schlesneria sp.]|nr:hypothetical protein [Schlesneria sp.]